jgi:hypothetical protein
MMDIAFAPTAGANGVDPDEPAPIDHAIKRLPVPATMMILRLPTETIFAEQPPWVYISYCIGFEFVFSCFKIMVAGQSSQ